MRFDSNKEKGNTGLALAIGYYGSNGYTVSVPLNDTQDYDLIVDNGEKLQRVQVKATGQRSEYGISVVELRSSGGTSGKVYKRVVDTIIDILFIVTELGELYEIPFNELSTTTSLNLGYNKQKFRVDNILTTYGTMIKTVEDKICINCDNKLSKYNTSGLCTNCAMKERRVVERPCKEQLLLELKESNFSAVGRKYGISDNSIRKWCKTYDLPTTAKEIKIFELND